MTNDPLAGLRASQAAFYVFGHLHRRGGSVRLRPLLRGLDMEPGRFVDAVNELKERYWIRVVWRPERPGAPEEEARPYTDVDRLVTTRFGRKKYRTSWPAP